MNNQIIYVMGLFFYTIGWVLINFFPYNLIPLSIGGLMLGYILSLMTLASGTTQPGLDVGHGVLSLRI